MKNKIFLIILLSLFVSRPTLAGTQKDSNFIELLKRYGAWEVIDLEIKNKNVPLAILNKANTKIFLNQPDEAITLLNKAVTLLNKKKDFKQKDLMGKAHLLLARAYRLKGDFFKAVVHYSLAADYLDKKNIFLEPDLDHFYKIVLFKWIVTELYSGNFLNPSFDLQTISMVALKGKVLWPKENVWDNCLQVLEGMKRQALKFNIPDTNLRDSLIKILASISIQDKINIKKHLNDLINPRQRALLSLISCAIFDTDSSSKYGEIFKGYPKYNSYLELFIPLLKQNHEKWCIDFSVSPTLLQFRDKLMKLDTTDGLSLIDKELNSLLLSDSIKLILRQIKIAYLLINQKYGKLKEEIPNIKFKDLPISLKICILLLTDKISSDIGLSSFEFNETILFLQPFGLNPFNINANFEISNKNLEKYIKKYSMDYLLRYSLLKVKLNTMMNNSDLKLLKEALFLYPGSMLSQRAILKLAKNSLDMRNLELFKK